MKLSIQSLAQKALWVLPVYLFFLELVFAVFVLGGLTLTRSLLCLLFSASAGLLCTLASTLFSPAFNRFVTVGFMAAFALIFSVQTVYHKLFGCLMILYSVSGGGAALGQFGDQAVAGLLSALPLIAVYILPMIAFLFFTGKKRKTPLETSPIPLKGKCILAACGVVLHLLALLVILLCGKNVQELYFSDFAVDNAATQFGLITAERLDVQHNLLGGGRAALELETPVEESTSSAQTPEADRGFTPADQVLDIDFTALIDSETDQTLSAMHQYFATQEPSKTNEYTGYFKGKNLITLTCEAFSPYVISKELTPTLYKMQQEGFVFENFYTPSWGVSTSDGEYVTMTGLIPKAGIWSFKTSGEKGVFLPFNLGMQFRNLGIMPYAYHNNTYDYYGRDLSHPNLGYTYQGLGLGLEVARWWPESDLEMIELSTADYISDTPFHAYYMTVSGHKNYNWTGNMMAYKHKDAVAHLPYSEPVKAYIACTMELDLAMEELLSRLEEAGVAEDTVIALSPDHWPYGLTKEELGELAGRPIGDDFDLYRGVFLLYSPGMEAPIRIEKAGSSLDILPTLSNLFGLEYDSRLLMGRDILSDSAPLIMLSDRSWMTDKGKFSWSTQTFTPASDSTVTDGYIERMNTAVKNKFTVSAQILDHDYYAKVVDRERFAGGLGDGGITKE